MLKSSLSGAFAVVLAATAATAQTPAPTASAPASRTPPSLDIYGQLPGVESISLSASGERIAIVGVLGEQRRLLVMTPAGAPLLRSDVGQTKVRDVEWAGDAFVIASASQTVHRDYETFEIWSATIFDIEARKSRLAMAKADPAQGQEPFVASFYGYRKVGGRWYGYFGEVNTDWTKPWGTLQQADLATDNYHRISASSDYSQSWAIGTDGKIVATSLYDSKRGDWILKIGDRKVLERKSLLHETSLDGLGRTPDTVLVVDNEGPRLKLQEFPLAEGGKPVALWDDLSVGNLIRSTDDLLLGIRREDTHALVFADSEFQARWDATAKAFPGYQVTLESSTNDLKRMIVKTDGGDDPGTYWFVDVNAGSAKVVGAAYPAIHARDVGPTRVYAYKAADGLELDGVLTLPPGGAQRGLPVVVMPHGGPIGVHDEVGFDWWAQAFASRGYAVFQPNYRGSSGRGIAFERLGYKEWGRRMLSDMADGLQALAREGVVDPKRACIVGASYGGYAAMAGITVQTGLYRCAVAVSGVSDVTEMLNWDREHFGPLNAAFRFQKTALGVGAADAPRLEDISPIRFAGRADAPLLLIHGTDDSVVDIEQSRRMNQALKAAGKPVDYIELKGDDHWMSHGDTRAALLKASVAFVLRLNPPG